MTVQTVRFGVAGAAFSPTAANDLLLIAVLDMDMSRLGIATTIAYRTITQRKIAPMSDRDWA